MFGYAASSFHIKSDLILFTHKTSGDFIDICHGI